jgi:hypothetical protein
MDAHSDTDAAAQKQSNRNFLLNLILAVVFALALFALSISRLDGPNSRRAANEAVAVGNLRRIATLQAQYETAHPTKGFSCVLADLKQEPPPNNAYDPDTFLVTDSHAGYTFALGGCETSAGVKVTRYRATAVPRDPGKSGVRAFCTDQSGGIWYDSGGSAEKCLVSHQPI